MDKDKFKEFVSNAFGERHLDGSKTVKEDIETIPGTGISYCDIPLHTLGIRKFIHTNLQIINVDKGVSEIYKHQLLREIFKNWYIIGWDRALTWLSTYHGGIDTATAKIKSWEDKHYPNDDSKRTDCSNAEKVAFRIAIITGSEILNSCKAYKDFKEEDKVTALLYNEIIKHTKN